MDDTLSRVLFSWITNPGALPSSTFTVILTSCGLVSWVAHISSVSVDRTFIINSEEFPFFIATLISNFLNSSNDSVSMESRWLRVVYGLWLKASATTFAFSG